MYLYFDHAIYINGHADDFFIGKETKTKTWPKLAHFTVQVNCRKEGIKDLSIILAVYGPKNWIFFAIYCPRNEWESFWLFMGPLVSKHRNWNNVQQILCNYHSNV